MKKAVIFLVILIGGSCYAQDKKKEVSKNILEIRSMFQNYLHIGNYAASGASKSVDIATVVVKIPNASWLVQEIPKTPLVNEDLIYATDLSNSVYFVDLSLIQNDRSNEKKAKWLVDNRPHIDYDATRKFTVDAHRIPHPEEIASIYPEVKDPPATNLIIKTTWGEILDRINDGNATVFNNDAYNNYIEFKPDATRNLVAIKHPVYTSNGVNLFSIQMLKGLKELHGLLTDSVIYIAETTFNGSRFPFIWLADAKCYYNYSNEPR